ncbi:YjgF-like protein, partial [Linderina pennispora]
SSNPTEASQGYAQLVRAGPLIYISGVSALDSHSGRMPAHLVLEAAGQTRAIMRRIRQLLETVGCSEKSIVRMRIYVVDMVRDSRQIQLAMTQWLNESAEGAAMKPGITIVEVRRLSSEPVLLEVEVDAV